MMGKIRALIPCILLTAVIYGCSNGSEAAVRVENKSPGVEEVLEKGMAEADAGSTGEQTGESGEYSLTKSLDEYYSEEKTGERKSGLNDGAPEPESFEDEKSALSGTEGIDVDLTAISSTMVYSEVYNMMIDPEQYVGKKIKMRGLFSTYHDEASGKDYHACIIQDATACCSQGIEFELTDGYVYPDDYPEVGGDITVVGTFDIYEEGEMKYCTLRNAELVS